MINQNIKYAKVEGHPNLLRDLSTNAIVNTDSISSGHYTMLKNRKISEKTKIDNLESELCELKSSINEIKCLLKDLINES
jgi:formiminotetrahydrofolate cyclodeaminase